MFCGALEKRWRGDGGKKSRERRGAAALHTGETGKGGGGSGKKKVWGEGRGKAGRGRRERRRRLGDGETGPHIRNERVVSHWLSALTADTWQSVTLHRQACDGDRVTEMPADLAPPQFVLTLELESGPAGRLVHPTALAALPGPLIQ